MTFAIVMAKVIGLFVNIKNQSSIILLQYQKLTSKYL